jgi:cytochrome c-type biogenesis protein CcmF
MIAWKRGAVRPILRRLTPAGGVAILAFAATLWDRGADSWLAGLGMAAAAWVIAGTLTDLSGRLGLGRVSPGESAARAGRLPRAYWGMVLAHAGVGVLVAGVTASSAWQTESILTMRPGDTVEVAGYDFAFRGAENARGPNYTATRGIFAVTRDGAPVATLTPEKRNYPAEQSSTTEAAIHTTWMADLYAVIGEPDGNGAWSVRIYHNPLVPWIWAGALFMAFGGLASLTDRRLRVGAPRRSARRVAGDAGAEPAKA